MRRPIILFICLLLFSPAAMAQDWSTSGGEARKAEIIRRFKTLLERTPSEGMAFKRLVSYVGKGKKLDKLIGEYQKKVEKNPDKANYRLILGHLLKSRNKNEEALKQYEKAVELEPKNALTWLSRGSIHVQLKKMDLATKDFEKALSLEKNKDKKQEILRKLADTAFAQRDWERATKYYDQLVALNPRSEYLRLEYAQILIRYKRFDKALVQYNSLLKLAGRDAKTKATTMRDMGDLYEKMGKNDDALKTYKKAQNLMKKGHWLHRALEQRIVGLYRRTDKLNELIAIYEKRWRNPNYDQAMLLGDLYDEIGNEDKSLKEYQRAIRKNRRQPDPRVKEIRILERRGDDKKIVKAYTDLIRVAPGESRYQFELVKVYFRGGSKKKAVALLSKIEKRFRRSTDTYILLADAYLNYDLRKDALRIYKRLMALEPKNDAFILALGEFYFQSGDTNKAVSVWVKLLKSDLDKGEAYARLGQVLGDHGLIEKGLDYFEKAVKIAPKDQNVRRGLALAYEHARRPTKAIESWEYLLKTSDKALIRNEARKRIINLYYRENTLRKRMREYALAFEKGETDPGFFLAAGYAKFAEYEESENILKKIQERGAKLGGEEGLKLQIMALNSLEKHFTRTGELKKSIAVLEKLAELMPVRQREYYQQIAEHSLKLFEDDKAVHYATLAVKANPDDATAQARLGRIYQKMGNHEGALVQYRQAVDIDPRAFDIQFQLAEMLVVLKKFKEAEKLFIFIVKKAPGGSLVARAGESAIDLAESDGRLGEIEAEFFPLVYRTPPKPVYKEMMLDIYEKLVSGTIDIERFGTGPEKEKAKEEMADIGRRSLPVLIDALQTKGGNLRARALRLITNLRPKGAALAVGRLLDDKEDPLRVPAMIAAARIGDPRSSPAVARASKDSKVLVRFMSLWALGATGGKVAEGALTEILKKNGVYDEQVVAAISLGRIGSKEAQSALREFYKTNSGSTNNAIVSTIWAFGRSKDAQSVPLLKTALSVPFLSSIAAWSLAEIGSDEALKILLGAYWSSDVEIRRGANRGLRNFFSTRETIILADEIQSEMQLVDLRGRWFETKSLVDNFLRQSKRISTQINLEKFEKSLPIIAAEAKRGLNLENGIAQRVVQTFACEKGVGFGDVVGCGKSAKLRETVANLSGPIRAKASLENPETFLLLGELGQSADFAALIKGASSKNVRIRKSSIQALGAYGQKAESALIDAAKDSSPVIRSGAYRSLARIENGSSKSESVTISGLEDEYASVRISAARALAKRKSKTAVAPLIEGLNGASRSITIVYVYALSQIGGTDSQTTLARYKSHADLRIRDAANGIDSGARL